MINTRINIKQIMKKDMLRLMPTKEAVVIIKISENEHRFRSDLRLGSLVLVTTDTGLVLYDVMSYSKSKGIVDITLSKRRCVYDNERAS